MQAYRHIIWHGDAQWHAIIHCSSYAVQKKKKPYLHSRKEDEIDYVDFGSEFMLTTFTSN